MSVGPEDNNQRVITQQNQIEFSTGLFSCCADCKTCLCALCCLPCMMCSAATRAGESCFACFCLPQLRTKLRTMYGIKGSVCMDAVVGTCCYTCAACQFERELTHVGL